MKVILLASGRSFRMKPVEDKNFLDFCGRSLLEHQLLALKSAGLYQVVLVGGRHNLAKMRG
ncbi:MAG: NTP transferase domain-containing protein, partial [Patescibacteria group bacterium]